MLGTKTQKTFTNFGPVNNRVLGFRFQSQYGVEHSIFLCYDNIQHRIVFRNRIGLHDHCEVEINLTKIEHNCIIKIPAKKYTMENSLTKRKEARRKDVDHDFKLIDITYFLIVHKENLILFETVNWSSIKNDITFEHIVEYGIYLGPVLEITLKVEGYLLENKEKRHA